MQMRESTPGIRPKEGLDGGGGEDRCQCNGTRIMRLMSKSFNWVNLIRSMRAVPNVEVDINWKDVY